MMEMVGFCVTSVHFYQTVECHVPQNSKLLNQYHEIMKFHMGDMAVVTWKVNQDATRKKFCLKPATDLTHTISSPWWRKH